MVTNYPNNNNNNKHLAWEKKTQENEKPKHF